MDKLILDVCCGSRMFWFDKNNPDVLFCDNREIDYEVNRGTKEKPRIEKKSVCPDMIIDFRQMPFKDNTFLHVVFALPAQWQPNGDKNNP